MNPRVEHFVCREKISGHEAWGLYALFGTLGYSGMDRRRTSADIACTPLFAFFSGGPLNRLARKLMMLRGTSNPVSTRRTALLIMVFTAAGTANLVAQYSYHVIPGRGQKVTEVGDDFEDPEWAYHENAPKSSSNIDSQDRLPSGISK